MTVMIWKRNIARPLLLRGGQTITWWVTWLLIPRLGAQCGGYGRLREESASFQSVER